MPRPTTKAELLEASENGFKKLCDHIDSMTQAELSEEFDFSADTGKKEAHWRRDKNLRDILIHLYEWHMLLLNCVEANKTGYAPFLPEGFNWRNYGKMNEEFRTKHLATSAERAMELLKKSHADVTALAGSFTEEELFTKGLYKWTGSSALASYFISNTSSHYEWALKKLKAHRKKLKERGTL